MAREPRNPYTTHPVSLRRLSADAARLSGEVERAFSPVIAALRRVAELDRQVAEHRAAQDRAFTTAVEELLTNGLTDRVVIGLRDAAALSQQPGGNVPPLARAVAHAARVLRGRAQEAGADAGPAIAAALQSDGDAVVAAVEKLDVPPGVDDDAAAYEAGVAPETARALSGAAGRLLMLGRLYAGCESHGWLKDADPPAWLRHVPAAGRGRWQLAAAVAAGSDSRKG